MKYSPETIKEIRDRIPLSTLVSRHVKLKKKGREHSGLCPFHSEKTPSFTVNDDKQFYHCFGCGEHGSHVDVLMKLENKTFPDTLKELAGLAGVRLVEETVEVRAVRDHQTHLKEMMREAAQWYHRNLALPEHLKVLTYLKDRKVSDASLETFQVGYAPSTAGVFPYLRKKGYSDKDFLDAGLAIQGQEGLFDRFRGRIMFPIWDGRGDVIAFGGRAFEDKEPKYLNSPETVLFDKGRTLYGLHLARQHMRTSMGLVAEGYMDVIALHQAGFQTAVAPLGTALTENHIEILWRYTPEPILCFDGDQAGRRAASRAADRVCSILKAGHSIQFIYLPEGEDPDTLLLKHGARFFESLLKNPQPLFEKIFEDEVAVKPTDTPERRAAFYERLKEREKSIVNPVLQRLYSQFISDKTRTYFFEKRKNTTKTPKISLPKVGKAQDLSEVALLACLFASPDLLDIFGEEIGHIKFENHQYEKIRQILVEYSCGKTSSFDESLVEHCQRIGHSESVAKICSMHTYSLFPFASPSANDKKREEAVRRLLEKMMTKSHVKQTQDSDSLFTDDGWNKFKRLFQEGEM